MIQIQIVFASKIKRPGSINILFILSYIDLFEYNGHNIWYLRSKRASHNTLYIQTTTQSIPHDARRPNPGPRW